MRATYFGAVRASLPQFEMSAPARLNPVFRQCVGVDFVLDLLEDRGELEAQLREVRGIGRQRHAVLGDLGRIAHEAGEDIGGELHHLRLEQGGVLFRRGGIAHGGGPRSGGEFHPTR
jgi:hypothetical protein